MDFIDDTAAASSERSFTPSLHGESDSSPRPRKRRRVSLQSDFTDTETGLAPITDEYDLPSNDARDYIQVDDEFVGADQPSKYEALMHEPAFVESQKNVFVTQVDQPWSSPTRIRGPRWKKKSPTPSPSPPKPTNVLRPANVNQLPQLQGHVPVPIPDAAEEFDDDELEALLADQDFDNITYDAQARQPTAISQPKSFRQTTLHGINTTQRPVSSTSNQSQAHNWPLANRNETPTHHKVDREAMKTWIYPMNIGSVRAYQFSIVHKALYNNVLVALPTGLGKTFIAATVMLNWFNWTKDSQIVFMAPTKPLVSQQVDACFNIAGIPRSQTTMLTGDTSVPVRAEEWQEKRVFFMTPQTFINDLKTGIADPKRIVLVVVDEAHKATGSYSYVEVVRFLRRFNSSFRVLALTATPGATVEAVQKVIDSLDIARVEIRTEESMDIREYVHMRNTDLQLFDYSVEMDRCLELFGKALQPVMNKLSAQNAYWSKDPIKITLYGLRKASQQWRFSDAGKNANQGLKAMVAACFRPLMSLAHNLELLKFHGIGPFYHKMKLFENESYGLGKYAKIIVEQEDFKTLMSTMKGWVTSDDFVGHPKLEYLKSVVLNHFMDAAEGTGRAGGRPPSETRIMIFAHYRDSAEEITRVLNMHGPIIRAHIFVGQSNTKNTEGMDQKKQIDIIKKFKSGTYNTLVATSIGEEGLDIGEVDLIVCYDCSKSPIRMLQRMGRTGRKRAGNIVVLLMRDKEERDYYQAKDNYQQMQEMIECGERFEFHVDRSPRIVPHEIKPVVDKRAVEIPIENTQPGSIEPRKKKSGKTKRPPKKFHMPDGVETGFTFLSRNKRPKVEQIQIADVALLDQETAVLPDLRHIFLTEQEEMDLEEKYVNIPGTQPEAISVIQINAHPEKLLGLGTSHVVKHSSTTKNLVTAWKVMQEADRNWRRPREEDTILQYSPGTPTEEYPRAVSAHQKEKLQTEKPIDSIRLRSDSTVHDQDADEYDANDSFVGDGPLEQDLGKDSDSDENGFQRRQAESSGGAANPFYVSQDCAQDDESEQELPEVGSLFGQSSREQAMPVQNVTRRKRRNVIDDDDDDDDDEV